jgi:hypothetical protein
VAKVIRVKEGSLGRWIQAVLHLYAFWQVNCREYVGDSDVGWP